MSQYKVYNSFNELRAANSSPSSTAYLDGRFASIRPTRNSSIADLIQNYDRIVKNLQSTEQLMTTASETAQPEVQAELVKPKNKYETELLKAKQKIVDELSVSSMDEFDRSILASASEKTKVDLTPLLAGSKLQPTVTPPTQQQPIPTPGPATAAPPPPPTTVDIDNV
jgi:hypothetical protein